MEYQTEYLHIVYGSKQKYCISNTFCYDYLQNPVLGGIHGCVSTEKRAFKGVGYWHDPKLVSNLSDDRSKFKPEKFALLTGLGKTELERITQAVTPHAIILKKGNSH